MRSIFRICIPAAGLLAGIASAQPFYTVTELQPLQGGNFSMAGINNTALAGGVSNVSEGDQHAVLWPRGWTIPIDIGPQGLNSGVFALSDRGQGAVQAEIPEEDLNNANFCGYGTNRKCRPFLWQQQNGLTPLPLLGGNNGTVGGINNRGQISGWAETATMDPDCAPPQKLDFQAVVWGPKPGDLRHLLPLPGDTVSMSIWINDRGQAVGTSGSCADTGLLPLGHGAHPVLWEADGSALDIGRTNPADEFGGIALGINNAGQVVGAAQLPDGSVVAFLWSRQTGTRKLLPLPGDVGSGAVSINDQGDAVGQSFDAEGNVSPVIWRNGGDPKNLNDSAPGSPLYLLWPTTINAQGQISGFGVTGEGELHGFLATPGGARSQNAASVAHGPTRPAVLPQSIRAILHKRFGVGRR